MVRLVSWLVRGQCLWHDEPIFDRDETGAIFRCPRCLHSWPRLQDATEPPRQVMPASVRAVVTTPRPHAPRTATA
ncbi:MAG: hypothetical protein AB7H88_10375 [Vicinamibacterales bacterium]